MAFAYGDCTANHGVWQFWYFRAVTEVVLRDIRIAEKARSPPHAEAGRGHFRAGNSQSVCCFTLTGFRRDSVTFQCL